MIASEKYLQIQHERKHRHELAGWRGGEGGSWIDWQDSLSLNPERRPQQGTCCDNSAAQVSRSNIAIGMGATRLTRQARAPTSSPCFLWLAHVFRCES